MLRPRIIPCLLIKNGGLVKTVNFSSPKYVGDPINAVRIFNEKEVDEILVVDIDATVLGREPDYGMIKSLAAECRMPLCYGGGVKSVEEIERIVSLGVEKVALSSVAMEKLELVKKAARRVGSQSIVGIMDVRKLGGENVYEVYTHNGSKPTGWRPDVLAKQMEELGAGEVVINSIDRDGVMDGYDMDLVAQVRKATSLPLTVLGGAGSLKDIEALIRSYGIIGAAAGSLFVFKGVYRAVLINYPKRSEKDSLITQAMQRA